MQIFTGTLVCLTPHRQETNGMAESAGKRLKEGTSSFSRQSGLDEQWWAESMECFCYLRSVHAFLSTGKTPHEWRFEEQFSGRIHPFRSESRI